MKNKIAFLFAFLAFVSTNVFADGCTNPKSAYDKTFCTAKLFIASDTELNQTYNNLMHAVSPDVKNQLVKAQRSWIQYRDQTCSSEGTIDVNCNFKVNKDRLTYLQDRLRECKTGHCQNQLIVARNFNSSN